MPYTWSVPSGLPPGLNVNASAGGLYGYPTAAGTFSIKVTDANGVEGALEECSELARGVYTLRGRRP